MMTNDHMRLGIAAHVLQRSDPARRGMFHPVAHAHAARRSLVMASRISRDASRSRNAADG